MPRSVLPHRHSPVGVEAVDQLAPFVDVVVLDTFGDVRLVRVEGHRDLVGRVAGDVEHDLERLGGREVGMHLLDQRLRVVGRLPQHRVGEAKRHPLTLRQVTALVVVHLVEQGLVRTAAHRTHTAQRAAQPQSAHPAPQAHQLGGHRVELAETGDGPHPAVERGPQVAVGIGGARGAGRRGALGHAVELAQRRSHPEPVVEHVDALHHAEGLVPQVAEAPPSLVLGEGRHVDHELLGQLQHRSVHRVEVQRRRPARQRLQVVDGHRGDRRQRVLGPPQEHRDPAPRQLHGALGAAPGSAPAPGRRPRRRPAPTPGPRPTGDHRPSCRDPSHRCRPRDGAASWRTVGAVSSSIPLATTYAVARTRSWQRHATPARRWTRSCTPTWASRVRSSPSTWPDSVPTMRPTW